jgi:hypothetical protein
MGFCSTVIEVSCDRRVSFFQGVSAMSERTRRAAVSGAACLGALAGLASGQAVVVPNSLATVEGGTSNAFPLSNTSQFHRYQQVFAATEFAAITGAHRIVGVRFRPNGTSTFPAWSATVTMDVRFSVTPQGPDQLVAAFASNVGASEALVYSGSATYGTLQTGPAATPPLNFDIELMFQTPYIYDPAAGNLLMDVVRTSTTMATNRFADAHSVTGDSVSRVQSSTVGATTGTIDSIGLVTQFIFEPIQAPCYANCDASTAVPALNVADFTCFLQKFASADPYANCDGSTSPPTLNVADFTCFLQKFAAGCP